MSERSGMLSQKEDYFHDDQWLGGITSSLIMISRQMGVVVWGKERGKRRGIEGAGVRQRGKGGGLAGHRGRR